MSTDWKGIFMNLLVLSLAIIIPIPFCWFRRKKYNISLLQMLVIYISFSTIGAIGACIGSYMAGGSIASVRLYGLIIFDSIALLIMSHIMKIDIGTMGDFIAVPIMVSCFSAKISCMIGGCCYGFVIRETSAGELIRFPSALFEMLLWAMVSVALLIIEKKGRAKNILWAIMVIWFGVFRFLASFLRGNKKEFIPIFAGISGGKLWSIVAIVIGLIYLYFLTKRNLGRRVKMSEYFKAIVGNSSDAD